MGENALYKVFAGDDIREDDINQFVTALTGDLIPRNLHGNKADRAANLGASGFRFGTIYVERIVGATNLAISHGDAAAPTVPSPVKGDIYLRTGSATGLWVCGRDGVWTNVDGSEVIGSGDDLPANPSVKDIFIKTGGGDEGLYYCRTAGTWTEAAEDELIQSGDDLPANPTVKNIFIKTGGSSPGFYYCKTAGAWTHADAAPDWADIRNKPRISDHTVDVAAFNNFMAALRKTTTLDLGVSNPTVRVAISDAAYAMPNNPVLPVSNLVDAYVDFYIGDQLSHTFLISTLQGKPEVDVATQLDDNNAVSWTEGGTKYYVARQRGNNRILFSADDIGDYDGLKIELDRIVIPAAVLPMASGSSAGIIGADEFDKIHAAVDAAHLHDTPALLNIHIQPTDAVLMDDASVGDGDGSQLREIYFSELDKRWFKRVDRIPDGNLSKKAEDFLATASEGGWKDSVDMFVQNGILSAVKPTLSIATARNYVATIERGPRYVNVWDIIRVPKDESVAQARYSIGERDAADNTFTNIASPAWEKVGTQGAYDYYIVQVADKPAASSQYIEEHDKFTVDGNKVLITGTATSAVSPLVLTAGVLSVDDEKLPTFWSGTQAQYDAIAVKDANTLYYIED